MVCMGHMVMDTRVPAMHRQVRPLPHAATRQSTLLTPACLPACLPAVLQCLSRIVDVVEPSMLPQAWVAAAFTAMQGAITAGEQEQRAAEAAAAAAVAAAAEAADGMEVGGGARGACARKGSLSCCHAAHKALALHLHTITAIWPAWAEPKAVLACVVDDVVSSNAMLQDEDEEEEEEEDIEDTDEDEEEEEDSGGHGGGLDVQGFAGWGWGWGRSKLAA